MSPLMRIMERSKLLSYYRMDMSETEKQAQMFKGLNNLRANGHIKNIIEKMFDFDMEVVELVKELFSVKETMSPHCLSK